jgi:CheY-like chemotaxis protein
MPKPVLLVAEDNAIDALLLERLVERCGNHFRMIHVEHGEAVIDYLQGRPPYDDRITYTPPALVLLDLKMPRKDGFDVLRWRQENAVFARLPVVVFSSSNLPADISRAFALGANSYVVKASDPLRLERMVKAMYEWWCEFNVTSSPS